MSPSKSRKRVSHKKKSSNKKIIMIIALLAVVAVTIGVIIMMNNNGNSSESSMIVDNGSSDNSSVVSDGASNENVSTPMKVLLETSMGNITIQLRDDMPITTGNFRNLVQQGVYDDTIFHRVMSNFMIQGGDPTGTGYGDPSIPAIPDEFSKNSDNNKNNRGTIAMANAGANTGSSQFFINVVNNNYLDGVHPVFGEVIAGMNVADAISNVATGTNDRPINAVTLIRATLID
jgi:peptidylprolyl isomerase